MYRTFAAILAFTIWASAEQAYHSQGLSFEVPMAFSQPAKAGLGAEELHFPADSDRVDAEIITFVAEADQVQATERAGQSIDRYFATTYLGLDWKPEQINKAVIGDLGGRHLVFHSDLKRPCRVDIYERDLADGRFFAVALRTYAAVGEKQRIEIGEMLRRSLKLQP